MYIVKFCTITAIKLQKDRKEISLAKLIAAKSTLCKNILQYIMTRLITFLSSIYFEKLHLQKNCF